MTRPKGSPISVFESLGLRNIQDLQLKARLAEILNDSLTAQRESQMKLAKRLGISQPRVSALRNYRLSDFSAAELIRLLTKLGHDVAVTVDPVLRPEGNLLVESRRAETSPVSHPAIMSHYGVASPRSSGPESAIARTQIFCVNLQNAGFWNEIPGARDRQISAVPGSSRAVPVLMDSNI